MDYLDRLSAFVEAVGLDRLPEDDRPIGFKHQCRFDFVVNTLKLSGVGFETHGIDAGIRSNSPG